MKRSLSPAPLIALLVDPLSDIYTSSDIADALMNMSMHLCSACDFITDDPDELLETHSVVFLEGERRLWCDTMLTINRMTTQMLERHIEAIELLPPTDPDILHFTPENLFVIGSLDFCLTSVHWLATGRGGYGWSWGLLLMRELAKAEIGEMHWMHDGNDFTSASFTQMHENLKYAVRPSEIYIKRIAPL